MPEHSFQLRVGRSALLPHAHPTRHVLLVQQRVLNANDLQRTSTREKNFITHILYSILSVELYSRSALTLLVGQQEGHPACKKLRGGVLACLSVWSKVQTCIWPSGFHCHSLSLASVKSRLVLPLCYRLTHIVPDKGPLNGCVCVYM